MNVIDTKNISYNVIAKLGEGSQGTTFLLEDRKHIVKLFHKSIDSTVAKSKINFLLNLGLNKNIFAIPLRQINQPRNGYIAEFASGMVPLTEIRMHSAINNLSEWYLSTGGLLRRYNILTKLASILRVLHSKGMAYCDLSPNNVFISEKVDNGHVFLIDMDNLRYKTSILNNIYTPFYGAPEIVSNASPNTTMSDSYSFAVLAYELLTLNHPLIGDYVSEGEPEIEDMALNGKIPWVEHSTDSQNIRSTGLPSNKVIPKKLMSLFRKNFETGLLNPLERPTMAEWYDALNLAQNELLKCGNNACGLLYPYNNEQKCTFCGDKPAHLTRIQMRRWEEVEFYDKEQNKVKKVFRLEPDIFDEILIDENTPKDIPAFNFMFSDIDPFLPIIKIEYLNDNGEDKMRLTPYSQIAFYVSPRTGITDKVKSLVLDKSKKIKIIDSSLSDKQKYMLHVKELNISQRVLTID